MSTPNTQSEKLFYIRNEGYLGNALIWWKKSRNGYTCDIKDALQVNEQEAKEICRRPEDSAYECDYIDNLFAAQKLSKLAKTKPA